VASLTRRTSNREAVEGTVLRATEALLEGGASFAELPVERIAREAGISRPAFYFYFRDKRELLMRLTEDVSGLLYAEAEGWWSGDTSLREALERIVALYDEHAALLRAVVETAAYDEQVAGFWRALVGRFVEATQARIEDGETPAETAFLLVWMTERTCYQRLVQGGGDAADPAFVSALVELWERGVQPARTPPSRTRA
jgi:TetR/AcrR family transcriptional regulator, ethionamide resistance regulator